MRFDLSDLRLFLNVVEAGSITHGAERMHLAIAAASTRIRNMEAALGTPLLHRERQGVQPTPAGRTLVHHARILLQQAERMHGDLAQYAEGIKGQVRLLSNTNALTEFLPEPLSDFLATHPQVNIDLEERLSDEIVAAVADGTADIGIVAATVEVAGLETLPFRTDRFVLVVAPKHPLATVEHIPFAEVLDFDFVGLDRTSALQRFLSEKAERIGRRLKLRVQLRSFDAVCRFVECNVGIGIVPATTAERHAKTMSIRRIELADSWALRNLTICIRRRGRSPDLRPRPRPPLVRVPIAFAASKIAMSRPHPEIPAQSAKRRADQLLVERGLAESRAKAQALILAGVVNCAGRRIEKPGEQLAADAVLTSRGTTIPGYPAGASSSLTPSTISGSQSMVKRPSILVHRRAVLPTCCCRAGPDASTPLMSDTVSSPGNCGRIRGLSSTSG